MCAVELDQGRRPRPAPARPSVAVLLGLIGLVPACSKSSSESPPESSPPSARASGTEGSQAGREPPSRRAGTATASTEAPAARWYRGVFAPADTAEMPFFFELPAQGTRGAGRVVNGDNEIEFEASWSGNDVAIRFPLFHTAIHATAGSGGKLSGAWKMDSKSWGSIEIPFRADPVERPAPESRFDAKSLPGEPIDLGEKTTVWRARFSESGVVKITLRQPSPGVFTATVQFPSGNLVYLAGNGRGKGIRLSALSPQSMIFLTAKLGRDGRKLAGKWITGPKLEWREDMTAERTRDFEVEMTLRTAKRGQLLSMPQLARYLGKPLIVEIGGSWCDTCKHAAVALKEIYSRHRDRGLEVVTLTYEFTDDSAYNRRQAEAFKANYGLPWEVIPVDGSAENAWEIIPKGIEGVDASGFPITLFVNRDGAIHALHASFAGPENPEENRRHVELYERHAAAIVK
jgi:thiol-disulfide isomerase/thioredoxin